MPIALRPGVLHRITLNSESFLPEEERAVFLFAAPTDADLDEFERLSSEIDPDAKSPAARERSERASREFQRRALRLLRGWERFYDADGEPAAFHPDDEGGPSPESIAMLPRVSRFELASQVPFLGRLTPQEGD